ncbi:PREDICTED: natural killer cell receptor 2B4 isoform X2 [Chinchilla lanigera]|uniref:CD244 molecule n=1 Tax=Chinchilla lanigera TaxID=34839 RepID=A0A8C2W480_CHILA|nr:PREDICTED: natural killer cell receptor 2B4 isoform X2 [Chinchilla lanigera]
MTMLWQAVTLTLLLLLKGYQGQECSDIGDVVRLSGQSVSLQPPNTQMKAQSVEWKMNLFSHGSNMVILRLKNNKNLIYCPLALNYLNSTLNFDSETLTLHIQAAKPQYSGLYKLEITNENGTVSCIQFKVFIFDHVEKPLLQVEKKTMDEGKCQVVLSCLGSKNSSVSYAWYRGSKLIWTSRNLSHLVVQIDANEMNTYTCNVSNPASWASESLNLTQDCLESSPSELTVYEDIKEIRRNQYSEPTSQSQESAVTLYSVIQVSQKASFKKRNEDPSCSGTIYDQVGSRPVKAYNPARLSRKELENFKIHC